MDRKEKFRGPGFVLVIAIILLLTTAMLAVPFLLISTAGADVGASVGSPVGKIVGTIEGVQAGAADGREEGLSADDTEVYLDALQQAGNLIVLDSALKVENVNSIGDANAALYVFDANAQYSVDLTKAKVRFRNGGSEVVITVPTPRVSLYIDETSRQTLAQTNHLSLIVTAKDGMEGYANSMDELREKAYEKVSGNDTLKQIAMDSAVKQIRELVSAVSESSRTITVEFSGEEA